MLKGDVVNKALELKQEIDGDISVAGSIRLVPMRRVDARTVDDDLGYLIYQLMRESSAAVGRGQHSPPAQQ